MMATKEAKVVALSKELLQLCWDHAEDDSDTIIIGLAHALGRAIAQLSMTAQQRALQYSLEYITESVTLIDKFYDALSSVVGRFGANE
jgi:hypothetical protein